MMDFFGETLCPGPDRDFSSLPAESVKEAVLESGAVLLRGFEIRAQPLAKLLDELFTGLYHHPRRKHHPEAPTLGGVAQGRGAINLHCETSFVPIRPDVAAFWCEQPATTGGETTLCDGCSLLDAMPVEASRPLREQDVRYVVSQPKATLLESLGVTLQRNSDREIIKALRAMSGLEIIEDAEQIEYRYRTSAIVKRSRGRMALASSLLSFSEDALKMADGSDIPADVLDAMRTHSAELTYDHQWSAGDCLILDNWRVLHGRRSFEGDGRTAYAVFGYTDWCVGKR